MVLDLDDQATDLGDRIWKGQCIVDDLEDCIDTESCVWVCPVCMSRVPEKYVDGGVAKCNGVGRSYRVGNSLSDFCGVKLKKLFLMDLQRQSVVSVVKVSDIRF